MCSTISSSLQGCFLEEVNWIPFPKKVVGIENDMRVKIQNQTADLLDLEELTVWDAGFTYLWVG